MQGSGRDFKHEYKNNILLKLIKAKSYSKTVKNKDS